jgi:hypothetical protein
MIDYLGKLTIKDFVIPIRSAGYAVMQLVEALCYKLEGPNGVIGIFFLQNTYGCTMALGLTRPLNRMSTRNIFWGVKGAGA